MQLDAKVTKRFVERVQRIHAQFCQHIRGIPDQANLHWFASLTLNRLMIVTFLQTKGFLDGDRSYLQNRWLSHRKENKATVSFYRSLLLPLFHEDLGGLDRFHPRDQKNPAAIGNVPHLHSRLFQPQALEQTSPDIDIADNAIGEVLNFFGQYTWHLDGRPVRGDRELNPTIVGAIFEKTINQKQMGAYYTQEDITAYICQNVIVPYLLEAAEKKCPDAFSSSGTVWTRLYREPDRYIHASVRYGVIDDIGALIPLPESMAAGVDDVDARSDWDEMVTSSIGLPMETVREYIARRDRCLQIRRQLVDGQVLTFQELVRLNLDINLFAKDIIADCDQPQLLLALWTTLRNLTVLDPTCGSGAFLCAALTILHDLTSECLARIRTCAHLSPLPEFSAILAEVESQSSQRAFIVRSILTNNLYGVDIMEEAVEICKLQLWLRLIEPLQSVEQLESLPLLDAHIRVGNALVGSIHNATSQPTQYPTGPLPFHWFVEFPEVMQRGGFDIVVGNPPFVEVSKVTEPYSVDSFVTKACGNLYAYVMERCVDLVKLDGRCGLIMPLSGWSTERMQPLQSLAKKHWSHLLVSFLAGDANPSKLFEGVKFRLAIALAKRQEDQFTYHATSYVRWFAAERLHLFQRLTYFPCADMIRPGTFPKLGDPTTAAVLRKAQSKPPLRTAISSHGEHSLYYHNCPVNWIRATTFVPRFWSERDGYKTSTQIRRLKFASDQLRDAACCVINSTLFFMNWLTYSDCYHLTARELLDFNVGLEELCQTYGVELTELCTELMSDLQLHSRPRTYEYRTTGKVVYDEFYPKLSKPIIDCVDKFLARHLKLEPYELDHLIHFDEKYRLGT